MRSIQCLRSSGELQGREPGWAGHGGNRGRTRQDLRTWGKDAREAGEHIHELTESFELRPAFDGCNLLDIRRNHERADSGKRWQSRRPSRVASRILGTACSLDVQAYGKRNGGVDRVILDIFPESHRTSSMNKL